MKLMLSWSEAITSQRYLVHVIDIDGGSFLDFTPASWMTHNSKTISYTKIFRK